MPRHVNSPFSSLLLTAVVSLSAGALRQYHFVNQRNSWTEAQRYCREKHTDLVTINDTQEQNDIEQVIERGKPGANANRVWIGLRSTDTWIWSLDDSTYQYRNWAPENQQNKQQPEGDGDCAFMNQEGKWHDTKCSASKRFICYNASSKGFIHVQEEKTWTEAQRYCREKHTDLASVRNESENNKTKGIIPSSVWIGLHRLWVWSDNSTSTFTHWKPDKPNIKNNRHDICASIDTHEQKGWIDESCTERYPFVCYDENLVLIRQNLTWAGALNYCRHNDMDLVSVFSEDVQRRVEDVTASASSNHVWLGLRHSCVVGLWFWVNGQTLCYEQWAAGHGTGEEDCSPTVRSGAVRTRDQRWVSLPETDTNNFICIK